MAKILNFDDFLSSEELDKIYSWATEEFAPVKRMIIYASHTIDEFTFNRLKEIAAGFDIKLMRGDFDNVSFLELEKEKSKKQLKSLKVIDELYTVQKSIERLKILNQTI